MVTCGFSGLQYFTPRHHCTCAPYIEGGTYLAGTGVSSMSLPASLVADAGASLSSSQYPRLVEAKQGDPRFVTGSVNESLTATFAVWNLLDATMHELMPEQNYQTGYVRELQLRRMVQLVRRPEVRTYCEIGFNGGHSAAAMLHANPQVMVHAFDIMGWTYSNRTSAILRTMFGKRFRMHRGDSRVTVPEWTQKNPQACDLLFVDGDHSQHGAHLDMVNMRAAAAAHAVAVADDINSSPGRALEDLGECNGALFFTPKGSWSRSASHGPFPHLNSYTRCAAPSNLIVVSLVSRVSVCLLSGASCWRSSQVQLCQN